MPKWETFIPNEFEYDFENDKLAVHQLSIDEAIQCFYRKYAVRRNKKYKDRYKLVGSTNSGKNVCIIFQLKKRNVIRIITGWEI